MQDKNGKLTPEDKEKVGIWLKQKQINTCEVCNENRWSLADSLLSSVKLGSSLNPILGGDISPNVSIICSNCGNTKYFNAVIIGLVKSKHEIERENLQVTDA